MMPMLLAALLPLLPWLTQASDDVCVGTTCSSTVDEEAALMQLRGDAAAAPPEFTRGCDWIVRDDCKKEDRYACDCRAANPFGPCSPCPGSVHKGIVMKENDYCFQSGYFFPCQQGTFCKKVYGKGGVTEYRCGRADPVPPPPPKFSQGCEWLFKDDCKNQDASACACRAANWFGPCSICPKSAPKNPTVMKKGELCYAMLSYQRCEPGTLCTHTTAQGDYNGHRCV